MKSSLISAAVAAVGFASFLMVSRPSHLGAFVTETEARLVSGGSHCAYAFTAVTTPCTANTVVCGLYCTSCQFSQYPNYKQCQNPCTGCCTQCWPGCSPCYVCNAGGGGTMQCSLWNHVIPKKASCSK
jgi:hypothetical protein